MLSAGMSPASFRPTLQRLAKRTFDSDTKQLPWEVAKQRLTILPKDEIILDLLANCNIKVKIRRTPSLASKMLNQSMWDDMFLPC